MPIGNFTRQIFEQRAADRLTTAIRALADLAELQQRAAAELAAGTFDTEDFYASDPDAKANILGMLDQCGETYAWLTGKGQVPAPSGDPLAYAVFLIGLG